MIFERFYLECLAHASYLIGDPSTRAAAVVDPQRDVEQYLELAARHDLRIEHVILTHFHADFIAGHVELRERGARVYLGAGADAEFDFQPLADGDVISLGDVTLSALETPGHTPESICLLVRATSGAAPHAVLTGDTLFIGDVGRPDLMASVGVSADELARQLYRSLQDKLLTLPDETRVYPAHGAGSMCGRSLSTESVSTIGIQRQTNYALQPMSEQEFVDLVTADQPVAPAYFGFDAQLNRQDRATLQSVLAGIEALPRTRVLELHAGGAQLLDSRDADDYARKHLRGSINIGLGGQYATWAGTVLDRSKPIVLIAAPERIEESALRLGRIGFDQIAGYLEGGIDAVDEAETVTSQRIDAATLQGMMNAGKAPTILDVRTEKEWREKHIEGSTLIPLNQLSDRFAEVPRDTPLCVHCRSGYRSSIAASLLEGHGIDAVLDLSGGINGWDELTGRTVGESVEA